jgi:transposase InsO family protein
MKTIMNVNKLTTVKALEQFLAGTKPVTFAPEEHTQAVYAWIQQTLKKFRYTKMSKPHKGILMQYLIKITGYSRQQLVRLVQQFRETGQIAFKRIAIYRFPKKYTSADIRLLAELDNWHDTLSGPATKKLCERAYHRFGQTEYQRLSEISVAHLYNLRRSIPYTRQRWHYEKTKPKPSTIGMRRKPQPNGQPGYIRIDTVHQGDFDKQKGVYHINAVDEVTQFEVVCTVEKISEQYLIPVLEELLKAFPFVILNFHSDNGSEYVNQYVVKLLDKLLVEFTKSRPRHSNDNALAESKNGSIVRKTLGYAHIPQRLAPEVHAFNALYLTPYINYHRPCFFAETVIDSKGKECKKYRYESMMTPYDKFRSLPNAESYLKPGLTLLELDKEAMKTNDGEAARLMQQARMKLFKLIHEQKQAS